MVLYSIGVSTLIDGDRMAVANCAEDNRPGVLGGLLVFLLDSVLKFECERLSFNGSGGPGLGDEVRAKRLLEGTLVPPNS